MKFIPPVKLLVTIVPRGIGDRITEKFGAVGLELQYVLYGHGTANSDIVDYLGFDEPEKDVLAGFLPTSQIPIIQKKLDQEVRFAKQGTGISFSVPLSAVNLGFMERTGLENEIRGEWEEDPMNTPAKYDMIVYVMERDLCDLAMTAAKSAGARGGTVMRGREASSEGARKLFGFSIQPEKEILFVIVENKIKETVMKAVSQAVSKETEERIVAFSIPVDNVEGVGSKDK